MSSEKNTTEHRLARRISLPLLIFYGVGTILGAGIYVLIGKVVGSAGLLAPLAFVVAAVVAGMTAFSYSQLVVWFPRSAGEAYYVEQAFKISLLNKIVGYLVVFTGIVSAATLANGFAGYLTTFFDISRASAIIFVLVFVCSIALWGIAESMWLAAVITIIEISGLLLVVIFAGDSLTDFASKVDELFIPVSAAEITAVMAGAFLAFYAFVGFEDMVSVVEEVKNPETTMPRAIISALFLSTALYLLIAVVAVLGMPLDELAASNAPLRDLLAGKYAPAAQWISVISLFAILNGLLTQSIMGSRILYGMADQNRAPKFFRRVGITKTPWIATLFVCSLMLIFALWLPIVVLAKTTSFIILMVFFLVNLSLWRLRRSKEMESSSQLPAWPLCGAVLCLLLLLFQIYSLFE